MAKRSKTVENGQKESKVVKTVNTVQNSQKRSKIVKSGKKIKNGEKKNKKKVKNFQKRSKIVQLGQTLSKTINTGKNGKIGQNSILKKNTTKLQNVTFGTRLVF